MKLRKRLMTRVQKTMRRRGLNSGKDTYGKELVSMSVLLDNDKVDLGKINDD
jgi:hypothetical protein